MSFNWQEYLHLAAELEADASNNKQWPEARWRAAISRAYYAAHCIASDKLKTEGAHPPRYKSVHQFVIDRFNGSSDSKARTAGWQLDKMRRHRARADYDAVYHGNLGKGCQAVLRWSQSFVSSVPQIARITPPPPP